MIILMPRQGCPHIVSYRMSNSNWRMRCGKILPKDSTTMTLGADNTYPQLCRTCRDNQDEMTLGELNDNPRTAYNVFQSHFYNLRVHLQNEEIGPRDTYYYLTNKRWPKLNKIKDIIKKR